MITAPSTAPAGSVMYVSRRPNIFWELCAPCEEILAGPFSDQNEALKMVPIVRQWLQDIAPLDAACSMGVLRLGPNAIAKLGTITPRFARPDVLPEQTMATRIPSQWLLANATERHESYSGHIDPGFAPAHSAGEEEQT